ncbi:MAG: hypothetical protein DHS20C13_21940 [Thermodesulfobacteriota bacterium]|nr:MAG: hypothetical protein DHS20C13_21940 [Thermodesulfobacteriota bacterium]
MKLSIQKFNKYRIGTFCSLAVPLILLLQISLPGVALCIGFDGHTALESYSEGLCNENTLNTAAQSNSDYYLKNLNSSNDQHCGICIDIPISDKNTEYKAVSSNDLMPEIDIHQFVVYQITTQVFFESPNHNSFDQELPSKISFLELLHTTVITC